MLFGSTIFSSKTSMKTGLSFRSVVLICFAGTRNLYLWKTSVIIWYRYSMIFLWTQFVNSLVSLVPVFLIKDFMVKSYPRQGWLNPARSQPREAWSGHNALFLSKTHVPKMVSLDDVFFSQPVSTFTREWNSSSPSPPLPRRPNKFKTINREDR